MGILEEVPKIYDIFRRALHRCLLKSSVKRPVRAPVFFFFVTYAAT
jgi:hypothetical protein